MICVLVKLILQCWSGEEHVRGSAVRRADRVGAAEPGAGGRGTLPPPLQHHRDQDAHQRLHVPRLPRHEAHLSRSEVGESI